MHASTDRLDFAPPDTPGRLRALILALLVHGLLLAALAWGVRWNRDTQVLSADAELWSAVPQEAAPKLAEPPPEPVEPTPPPQPQPPAPPPQPVAAPPAPPPPQVDIALEQEKLRKQKELARLEALKQEKLQQKLEKDRLEKAKLEKARLEALKLEKLQQDKLKQEKLKQEKLQQDKLKQEKLLAEQAKQAQQAALDKKIAAQEAKQLEAQRQKVMQRMMGMAGASGTANATGTALKSSGPSASYGGRIRAKIKPNIVFTETIQGNPTAIVEVHTSPDGTIISRKLTQSSGVPSWDEAVIRAIDKTQVLPRDIDGSVPSLLSLEFRPKD
ncbi:cell envelope integrity protein TolA [Rhodoferax sp.]|uniref:cell envelope integrity protein TolA n=1 Tax=Rhodoferax sp. TaxID=50421 RepID=UPI00284AC05D|nr:cell envelope integrity protein TolA [Rhodoferax sp.]MDR3369615.1 cell envelope integrity protein TolA [Rhodoferax sp.]